MDAMPPPRGELTHVADTALLIAACRSLESESPDGLVRDPFALQLAGIRGMEILQALPDPQYLTFGMGVRTRFIDELLLETLHSKPITTVLSVGCGLDTRPWRLELPPHLRWIEADFSAILDYKDAILSAEPPRCQRERFSADLNDAAHRHALYSAAGPQPALLVTEGLLMYLPAGTVAALAAELPRHVTHWISDITTTMFERAINRGTPQSLLDVRAPDALEGEQIFDTLRRHDWTTEAWRSCITDMAFAKERIRRLFGQVPQVGATPVPPDDPTGVHRFARK